MLVEKAAVFLGQQLTTLAMQQCFISRGLLRSDSDTSELCASASGVVLLAKDPTNAFPQCRILADAFHGAEQTSKPDDQEDIPSRECWLMKASSQFSRQPSHTYKQSQHYP